MSADQPAGVPARQFERGDQVMIINTPSGVPHAYLTGRVGTVIGPRLIARHNEQGWDDLGVLEVDFGEISGYGHVTYEAHFSQFRLAGVPAPTPRQAEKEQEENPLSRGPAEVLRPDDRISAEPATWVRFKCVEAALSQHGNLWFIIEAIPRVPWFRKIGEAFSEADARLIVAALNDQTVAPTAAPRPALVEPLRKLLIEFENDNALARIGHYTMSVEAVALYLRQMRALLVSLPASGWQPIETLDPNDKRELFFWVRPLTAEESYLDTSGNPIFSAHAPRLHRGKRKTWSSLETATHWMPPPNPPVVSLPAKEPT